MYPVTKAYTFQSPDGPVTLKDLFGTKSQLIIYHYMFEPTAEEGCLSRRRTFGSFRG
jgi:predicted dithiol-disulfide oxidoreductase (DUF899 family)